MSSGVYPGNVRVWCPRECGWWREAPAISADWMLRERAAHMAAEHPTPTPSRGGETTPGVGRGGEEGTT